MHKEACSNYEIAQYEHKAFKIVRCAFLEKANGKMWKMKLYGIYKEQVVAKTKEHNINAEQFCKQTCSMKATTSTVIKRVAVSNNWKFKSISSPIIQPITTQNGICISLKMDVSCNCLNVRKLKLQRTGWNLLSKYSYHKHGYLRWWPYGNTQCNVLVVCKRLKMRTKAHNWVAERVESRGYLQVCFSWQT